LAIVALAVTIATLAALEIFLRIADFRELREGVNEHSLSYRYDAELGWFPASNSCSVVTNARTFHVPYFVAAADALRSSEKRARCVGRYDALQRLMPSKLAAMPR